MSHPETPACEQYIAGWDTPKHRLGEAPIEAEGFLLEKNFKNVIYPNPAGDWPEVASGAYIDPTARIIGKVKIGHQVFIGPNVVIRADEADDSGKVSPIVIEADCNIQDGVIIHALAGSQVNVGRQTSLAHGSIIHGPCILGANCFVGFRTVLYNVDIADNVFIGHGAVVCNVALPPHSLVSPGITIQTPKQVAELPKTGYTEKEFMKKVIVANINLCKGYLTLKLDVSAQDKPTSKHQ